MRKAYCDICGTEMPIPNPNEPTDKDIYEIIKLAEAHDVCKPCQEAIKITNWSVRIKRAIIENNTALPEAATP